MLPATIRRSLFFVWLYAAISILLFVKTNNVIQFEYFGAKFISVPRNDGAFQNVFECSCSRRYFYQPPGEHPQKLNSSCSDEGTFYWKGQRVVSYSMHFAGSNQTRRRKLYSDGIKENLEMINKFYPGYSMRLYTDEKLSGEYCHFVCNNNNLFWCDVRRTPSLGDQSRIFFMSWRFFTLGDPTVELFLSRDLDSLIIEREVAVVQDWLKLNKSIHLMRDNFNVHNIPILGGMWGARNSPLWEDAAEMRRKIIEMSGVKKPYKGLDQDILAKVVFYPRRKDIVAYDSYHCKYWSQYTLVRPFPRRRENSVNDFVGNCNLGRKRYKLPICPRECRYVQDWEYC